MRGVGVFPGSREVRIVEHPEPSLSSSHDLKLRILEVGVCGTDRDLCGFKFGAAPPGSDYFILGHESLAQVVETGREVTTVSPGDLVVCGVRHPCADPDCAPCRAGRQDFCATGRYRERGILGMHGFMTEFVVEADQYAWRVPGDLREVAVLIEPLTIAEKAFFEFQAIDARLPWRKDRRTALVLGAGPIGILGGMRFCIAGFETWVYSRSPADGAKAAIVKSIGARYVSSIEAPPRELARLIGNIDLVYEAMGAPQSALDVLPSLGANGVFIFTGVPPAGERLSLDLHRLLLQMIVKNQALLGTVNAGADAFEAAIRDLAVFRSRWPRALRSLITGRYPIECFRDAIHDRGIKNVLEIAA